MKRVALITGGSSGIGKACAEMLALENQIVIADLNQTQGQALASTLGGLYIQADLSEPEDCKKAY